MERNLEFVTLLHSVKNMMKNERMIKIGIGIFFWTNENKYDGE